MRTVTHFTLRVSIKLMAKIEITCCRHRCHRRCCRMVNCNYRFCLIVYSVRTFCIRLGRPLNALVFYFNFCFCCWKFHLSAFVFVYTHRFFCCYTSLAMSHDSLARQSIHNICSRFWCDVGILLALGVSESFEGFLCSKKHLFQLPNWRR